MALVVLFQEDEDVLSVYRNLKIFVKRSPDLGHLHPLGETPLLPLYANKKFARHFFFITLTFKKDTILYIRISVFSNIH